MKRKIVKINEEKCTGCGLCIPNCHEGALQIIDGKARLISDLFCDGLGACIGYCPEDAITIEEREAEAYDEKKVMSIIATQGKNTIIAHLHHLKEHGEEGYLKEAIEYIKENKIDLSMIDEDKNHEHHHHHGGGCPGSKSMDFRTLRREDNNSSNADCPSELRQWPVQMHLINPAASYFKNADVILAADCVAFAMGNFHNKYLKGKSLAIACPKLDSNKEGYIDKLKNMIEESKINTLTVMMMEVPCCGGLLQITKIASQQANRKIPIKAIYVSLSGEVISEEWI